jgi:hypothetical protein
MDKLSLTEEKEMDVSPDTVPARYFLSPHDCKVTEFVTKPIDFRLKRLPLREIRIIGKVRVKMIVKIVRVIGYAKVG